MKSHMRLGHWTSLSLSSKLKEIKLKGLSHWISKGFIGEYIFLKVSYWVEIEFDEWVWVWKNHNLIVFRKLCGGWTGNCNFEENDGYAVWFESGVEYCKNHLCHKSIRF